MELPRRPKYGAPIAPQIFIFLFLYRRQGGGFPRGAAPPEGEGNRKYITDDVLRKTRQLGIDRVHV